MARTREFDIDAALEKALVQFWEKGYESTSTQDLLEAIGIHKGSLYNTFGDKRSLYLKALEHYLDRVRNQVLDCFSSKPSPKSCLTEWVEATANRCCKKEGQKGCFAVNATVELASSDDDVRKVMREHFKKMEGLVSDLIQRGIDLGEFGASKNPQDSARFVVSFISGLYVRAKAQRFAKVEVEGLVDSLLAILVKKKD